MKSWSQIFLDPIALLNLLIRFILLFLVLYHGRWFIGDSPHYLNFSQEVCAGDWGGEPVKGPFYLWYLCALMPKVHYITGSGILSMTIKEMAPFVWIPLVLQSLLIWLGGVAIYKVTGLRWLMAFWLFDPVLLAYSNFLMPDVLFSFLLLMTMILIYQMITDHKNQTISRTIGVAFFLTSATLSRSNGFAILLIILAWFLWMVFEKKIGKKTFITFVIGLSLFLAPRLYWNYTKNNVFALSTQGERWLQSVAGVSENYGNGLDFYFSEQKWLSDHPKGTSTDIAHSLSTNWKTLAKLSIKGTLRVMYGHANIEWFQIIKGYAPLGPGWFKPSEIRAGNKVEGIEMAFWVIGIILGVTVTSAAYFIFFNLMFKLRRFDSWQAMTVIIVMIIATMPLVYGEARFRLGLWPFVLIGIAWIQHRLRNSSTIK